MVSLISYLHDFKFRHIRCDLEEIYILWILEKENRMLHYICLRNNMIHIFLFRFDIYYKVKYAVQVHSIFYVIK